MRFTVLVVCLLGIAYAHAAQQHVGDQQVLSAEVLEEKAHEFLLSDLSKAPPQSLQEPAPCASSSPPQPQQQPQHSTGTNTPPAQASQATPTPTPTPATKAWQKPPPSLTAPPQVTSVAAAAKALRGNRTDSEGSSFPVLPRGNITGTGEREHKKWDEHAKALFSAKRKDLVDAFRESHVTDSRPWNSTAIDDDVSNYGLQEPVAFTEGPCTREMLGRSTWNLLHAISVNFEPSMKQHFVKLVNSLSRIYPCSICRAHFQETLKRPHVSSSLEKVETRGDAILWVWNLHNEVNKNVERSLWPKAYDEKMPLQTVLDHVMSRWSEDYAREKYHGSLLPSTPPPK